MDFPTLGLNFDLNELIDGMRRIRDAKASFQDLGRAAEDTGDKAEGAGRKMTEASLAAEAAAFKSARAQKTEEDAIKARSRQLRDLERVMNDIDRAERLQRRMSGGNLDTQTASFRMRMNRQQAREAEQLAQTVADAQTRADRQSASTAQMIFQLRQRLTKQQAAEATRAVEEERRGWGRLADAIKMAADQTVRSAQTDAEARVRITQAAIAQNRQSALTQESLTREALLVDRLTRELTELGQARAASARQSAPAGSNANLLGAAAATTVAPVIATAQKSLAARQAQLAENDARNKGRTGILGYVAALFGLGRAYDDAGRRQNLFTGGIGGLSLGLSRVRRFAFDARFAVAALLGAITLGPLAAMADQMVALESRTRLYAERASDVPVLLEQTFLTAQRARQPLSGIATLYTRLAPLADQLGRSQMQLLRITETVAKAFSIGGAAASEATASAQQFAQAISSNRFGGDELRSVAENAPVLLQAIAEGVNQINPALNLNAATFIKWAQAGNATADIMVRALEYAQPKIDAMFSSFPVTISQATSLIQNSLTKMIDEIDRRSGEAGMRLSTNIAMGLQDFSAFLTDPTTINAAVKTIEILKATFDVLGKTVGYTVAYFPTLVTALTAFTLISQRAAIAAGWAVVMRGLGTAAAITSLQFTAAGGGLALFSGAAGVASAAALRLGAALRVATGFLAGPAGLLLALTGAAFGLNYMKENTLSLQGATDKLADTQSSSVNAFQRALTVVQTYGGNTDAAKKQVQELNDVINKTIGLTDDQTRGLSTAGQQALQRAKMEQTLTVSLLRRAAAEQIALQASLNRSAALKELDARAGELTARSPLPRLPGEQSREQLRANAAQSRREAEFDRTLAGMLSPQDLVRQADALAAMPLVVPDIPNGDGIGQPPNSKDKDKNGKGMAGAINSVARLRAEVLGLNEQIQALNANPLSDMAARIVAAGKEAAASRTAGKGAGFRDEAQRLAMLKEEASIRLELTRTMVDQERSAREAEQASRLSMWTDTATTRAMLDYYGGAARGANDYALALMQQSRAQVEGEKSMENLRIAQQYGATSVSEISAAYKQVLSESGLLTDETAAYADQLQVQAQRTMDAASAAIDLAAALKSQQQQNQAMLSRRQEIDDLERYAAALRAGAAAVDDYNRRQRVREAIQQEGPGVSTGVASVDRVLAMVQAIRVAGDVARKDAADYNVALGERTSEMEEQLRLATLTTRQRQLEAQAIALANAAGRKAANDNDRKNADQILKEQERADLKIGVQDSIRDAFIDTGKLNFKPLGDALAKTVRQKLYDALIAKPINIVVNAVVDFVSKGLDNLIGNFLQMAGPWGQAAAAALAVASMVLGREQIRDNRDYFQTAEETQALQGTGTVWGDLKAQSQSIRKSLDIAASYQNRTLEYSSGMLMALRNIESGIGSLTGLIGRQLGVGGALDTSDLGLGTTTKGPGLLTKILSPLAWIAPALFGKTTTTNLMDQGLQFNAQSLSSILSGGVNGFTYQDIEKNTKKKFLGVTYSNKTSYSTEKQALDAELATQIGLVIGSLKAGAVEAANVLGVTGADALLKSMMINIGRISFKDMNADQIQDQLNAVFSSIGDNMATLLLPAVSQFQQAGEGALETLVRLARQYQIVDVTLASIGKTFNLVGVGSIAARDRLINLVGGLEEFTSQAQFFADNFLTEKERLAPAQKAVTAEMKRLGLMGITTRDQFKRLIMGLDLTTEGGATMYAALMDLAPAFAAVTDGAEKAREQMARIFEFAQGLLTSSLSPLSPQQKLTIEQTEYEQLLARAKMGDVDALEKLTDASSEYLTAAQKYFASSPEYAAIFDKVYQELIALSGMEVQDPVVNAIETEIQRLIDAINAGFMLVANGGNLPDAPPVPGTGGSVGGGGGGGNPQVGGGSGWDPDGVMQELQNLSRTVAASGDAQVQATGSGLNRVADVTADGISRGGGSMGGMVRKQAV